MLSWIPYITYATSVFAFAGLLFLIFGKNNITEWQKRVSYISFLTYIVFVLTVISSVLVVTLFLYKIPFPSMFSYIFSVGNIVESDLYYYDILYYCSNVLIFIFFLTAGYGLVNLTGKKIMLFAFSFQIILLSIELKLLLNMIPSVSSAIVQSHGSHSYINSYIFGLPNALSPYWYISLFPSLLFTYSLMRYSVVLGNYKITGKM